VKATFIEPMLLLRTEKLPEGADWQYELLCGPPHRSASVALNVMWRWAHEGNERSIQLAAAPHKNVFGQERRFASRAAFLVNSKNPGHLRQVSEKILSSALLKLRLRSRGITAERFPTGPDLPFGQELTDIPAKCLTPVHRPRPCLRTRLHVPPRREMRASPRSRRGGDTPD
jgi:hypothetical protein